MEYTKEKLSKVVSESETYRQVLNAFNRNESSSSYKILKKHLNKWGLDTTHFLSPSEIAKKLYRDGKLIKKNNCEIFTENSNVGRGTIKKRIISEGLLPYKCLDCGNTGEWMGKKISLILDHINGINNDNRLENLRFLCPNCNSTLETHCLGSSGLKKHKVIDDVTKIKIDKRKIKHDRVEKRKVVWPTKEELINMVNSMSYCAIGRKYGVSDNAVRKWCKKYEII